MSADMLFYAALGFSKSAAVDAAWQELREEGYLQHEDNLIVEEIERVGNQVSCLWEGSAPASCFELTASVLEVLARHAEHGEAVALELEANWGYRYPGGYDSNDPDFDDELEEEAIEELHRRLALC